MIGHEQAPLCRGTLVACHGIAMDGPLWRRHGSAMSGGSDMELP